ncbi:MAG: c-type cytochrome [Bryobacterales bacterium]|nr:c-type cytochrome [Bryobacterales bacterium]
MIWLLILAAAPLVAQTQGGSVARGQEIYKQTCAVGYCHGLDGTAGRGPNMRGRALDPKHVERVIREGVPATGMPAFADFLSETDLRASVAYIMSLGKAQAQAVAPPAPAMPAAAARGYKHFFDSDKATNCATCHSLAGRGNAVGPDLSRLARLNPRGIQVAILSTRTQYVQEVKLKNGQTFPGMQLAADGETVQMYDLNQNPPALRALKRAEIDSMKDNVDWKHPAESVHFSKAELADIISYIRWASYGDKKGVTEDEL